MPDQESRVREPAQQVWIVYGYSGDPVAFSLGDYAEWDVMALGSEKDATAYLDEIQSALEAAKADLKELRRTGDIIYPKRPDPPALGLLRRLDPDFHSDVKSYDVRTMPFLPAKEADHA